MARNLIPAGAGGTDERHRGTGVVNSGQDVSLAIKWERRVSKIQAALGKNLHKAIPLAPGTGSDTAVGQAVMDSCGAWLSHYLTLDDGSDLTTSIYSANLRSSAQFSARNARLAYLLGKMTLLDADERKGIVRTQIIEYGSVCEAILVDIVQSVGIRDSPSGARPSVDDKKQAIDWANGGIFRTKAGSTGSLRHFITFDWLIRTARAIGVYDDILRNRIYWLKNSRNLVHAVIPTGQRYSDDLASAKSARQVVVDLRDACVVFKAANGLP